MKMTHVKVGQEFYVYTHRKPSTADIFYVGKGKGGRSHSTKSRNPHWRNITEKHGGFCVDIVVSNVDEELAFLIEMELIDKLRQDGVCLANMTDGGDGVSGYKNPKGAHNKGVPCSDEMKARISATLKEKGCLPPIGWNKGLKTPPEVTEKRSASLRASWAKSKQMGERHVSKETRKKMSAAKIGRKLPESTRIKLSEALKANKYARTVPDMTGFKHSDLAREKMSAAKTGRPATNRKAVICRDTGQVFESATAAARSFGKNQHTLIAACCNGSVRTAYGKTFEYQNV